MRSEPSRRAPRRRSGAAGPAAVLALAAAAWGAGGCGPGEDAEAERAAVARLRAIAAAETTAMREALVDLDGDGRGEALSWKELAGLVGPRTTASGEFRGDGVLGVLADREGWKVVERGIVHSGRGPGLLYRVYLPAAGGGDAVEGIGREPFSAPVDADLAEERWCAYAWPRGGEGWVYFVDPAGVVLRSSNAGLRYSAADRVPERNAAFLRGAPGGWHAPLAVGTVGNDGARWERVE